MALGIQQFHVGGFDKNLSYVVYDSTSREAFIVDPTGDVQQLLDFISEHTLHLKGVVLTHTHFDHFDTLPEVLAVHAVPVYVHEAGRSAVANADVVPLREGSALMLGISQLMVLHTPGHSPDSICLYAAPPEADPPFVISGDTLFVGGCGRTDLAHVADLYASLQRFLTLSPETMIYPGHDYGVTPVARLGDELVENTYFQATTLEEFIALRIYGYDVRDLKARSNECS